MEEWVSPALAITTDLDNGKGRGIVTTRPVRFMDLLMVARPFVVAPADKICGEAKRLLASAATDPRRKAQFLALSDGKRDLPSIDMGLFRGDGSYDAPGNISLAMIKGILETNVQGLESLTGGSDLDILPDGPPLPSVDRELCGLWLLPSLLNHACNASTSWVPVGDGMTLRIFASRDLPAGAELTDTYVNLFSPLGARTSELATQKAFVCTCERCRLEAKLPGDAAKAALDRQAAATARLKAEGTVFLKSWLQTAEETSSEADNVCERIAAKGGVDHEQLRSAFVALDISIAQTLLGLAGTGALAGDAGLCGRAAKACERAARSVAQVAPLSIYHVWLLDNALQMYLCLQTALKRQGTREVRNSASELAAVWCGRHGVSLGWPEDLEERCIAAFRRRDASGAVVEVLRPALRLLREGRSDRVSGVSGLWDCVARRLGSRKKASANTAPADVETSSIEQLPASCARVSWRLPDNVAREEITVDASSEAVRFNRGEEVAATLPWPRSVDVASAKVAFSRKTGCFVVSAAWGE